MKLTRPALFSFFFPAAPKKLPMRYFDLDDLQKYNGETPSEEHDGDKAIYIAVDGIVFDVTEGADFYGPGEFYIVTLLLRSKAERMKRRTRTGADYKMKDKT
jgi:hypothetical protein